MAEKMDSLDLESLIEVIKGIPGSESDKKLPSIDTLHRVLASAAAEDLPLLEWLSGKLKPHWIIGSRAIDLCIKVIKSRLTETTKSWSGEPEPHTGEDENASIAPLEPQKESKSTDRVRKRSDGGPS